ncbi:MAG: hypothetical protein LBP62_03330 [Clostridiales bacterium]|nr:hypothetical protein [Clostridiales bacterium]
MTIGKFTWGSIKLAVNFIFIAIFGMTTFYVYQTITTLPTKAEPLLLEIEGTNFGIDPTEYVTNDADGIGAILKGDYFATADGMDVTAKKAVSNGFSYYAFNYENISAAEIYKNADMSKINLWLGKGTIAEKYGFDGFDDYEYIKEKAFSNRDTYWEGDTYPGFTYQAGDMYPGDDKPLSASDTRVGTPKPLPKGDPRIGELKHKGGHPKLTADGRSFVEPTFSFESYDDMVSGLTKYFVTDSDKPDADGEAVVNAILSYWILRVGSQTDSYINFKTERMTGGGGGAGALGGVVISGELITNSYNIDYFNYQVDRNATMVASASSAIGVQALGPLLTVADFKIWGNSLNDEWTYYSATAKDQRDKLSSDPYTGPDGVYKSTEKTGTLPTLDGLKEMYEAMRTPERTPFDDTAEGIARLDEAKSEIRVCEFGMPASTYSAHIIDLRTIKEADEPKAPSGNATLYDVHITCYSRTDGAQWEWVSSDYARGIANGIGGYASDGGPVGHLYYTKLDIFFGVFESGFMRSWKSDEFWNASIAGMITADVTVGTESTFSYDVKEIWQDPLTGTGNELNNEDIMSIPGQVKKMQEIK